ncbi:MAG: NAD(P)-dependent dehydrogenase, short-chain alcohol dehydrogenase family [Verrucomicrobia bacterium]|jgi:NAD(P)-dependent dehydrogenase (short-subunit alcohol dehydrogenase family)|nr:MAG: NAD(P)-dependent dehydrogenase, short-chain alcohol dehydrogenase family [Verrucomicrobiota bacterium]
MSTYLENLFGLTGKSAVVIGGTGTLCGVMAQGLAEAGADVVIVGRSEEKAKERLDLIAAAGAKGTFFAADVADRASLQALCDHVVATHGKVDILINGAGVNSPTPFLEITDEEFLRILDINTAAVFRSCQIFGAQMLQQPGGGSVVNLGSISGLGPLSRVFTYSLSKAAVHNLTKNLAREWATQGIRVNTLVPGFFPAEQNRKVLTPDRVAKIMGHTPMNRFGEASELIGATLLLCSQAGSFITGHEMIVDGGFSAMTI